MSRKGNCWDAAVSVSFFHTLKSRLIHHRRYNTLEELNRDIYWYIEIYYNHVRKHSVNNWLRHKKKWRIVSILIEIRLNLPSVYSGQVQVIIVAISARALSFLIISFNR